MEILLFGVVLAAIGIIVLLVVASQNAAVNAEGQAAKVRSLQQIDGFNPAIVYEGLPSAYGVALDPASSKLAIIIPSAKPRLYHFSQIVAAEVVQDDKTITTTQGKVDTKGAALATLLAGPVGGLMVGASTSSTSTSSTLVTKLAIKLFINDLHSPCFEIPFSMGIPGSLKAAEDLKLLDQWYGRFRAIIADQQWLDTAGTQSEAVQHTEAAPALPEQGWWGRTFG